MNHVNAASIPKKNKFVVAVIFLLGIIFLIGSVSELRKIGNVLSQGNLWWMLLAVGLELLWILNYGASYKTLYRIMGIDKKLLPLTRLVAAVNFVNIVAPSAGLGGLAVIYSDASKNRHSSARVTVGSILFILFDYLGLLAVIFVGLIILSLYNSLSVTDILAYLLFLILALALSGTLILASRSEAQLSRVMTGFVSVSNNIARPFIKRDILDVNEVKIFAAELVEGVSALKHVRSGWLKPLALTFTNKILLVSILGVVFLAFNVQVTLAVVVAGFSLAYLFAIISPTPSGVGIVEGVMTLGLKSLGVPLESAVVVTLAYRGVTFWLALLIGMIAFRTLQQP